MARRPAVAAHRHRPATGGTAPWARLLATWLPLAAWLALIFWFSHQQQLPRAPEPLLDLLVKKGLHAAAYGVLALLWLRALRAAGAPAPAALAFALSVLSAAGDEWHQSFVPGRSGRLVDVFIDAAGAAAALAAVALGARRGRQ